MAHFAQLDNDNKVINVVVTDNNDPNGDEGYQWLLDNLGGTWVKTSYNSNIRGKFAGIGDTYDLVNDRFISKQPFSSWLLNADFNWQAPVSYPTDGKVYDWNEETLSWVKIEEQTNG
jgi:hypothetical protein